MKIYTYNMTCAFKFQYSFPANEVEREPGGRKSDMVPTEAAILDLEKELLEVLSQHYPVNWVGLDMDSSDFGGVSDDGV